MMLSSTLEVHPSSIVSGNGRHIIIKWVWLPKLEGGFDQTPRTPLGTGLL